MGHTSMGGKDGVPPPARPKKNQQKKVHSKKFLMAEWELEEASLDQRWRSDQSLGVGSVCAREFLPLGFVLQQVHLAHLRDAAASILPTSSSSSPSPCLLRTRLQGMTRLRVRLKGPSPPKSRRFLRFAVSYLSTGLRLTEFSAAFSKRTKWIFALGRPSPRLS